MQQCLEGRRTYCPGGTYGHITGQGEYSAKPVQQEPGRGDNSLPGDYSAKWQPRRCCNALKACRTYCPGGSYGRNKWARRILSQAGVAIAGRALVGQADQATLPRPTNPVRSSSCWWVSRPSYSQTKQRIPEPCHGDQHLTAMVATSAAHRLALACQQGGRVEQNLLEQ